MICKNCSVEFNGAICPECNTPAEEIGQEVELAEKPIIEADESESYYDEPERDDGDVIDAPKKKKKTGLIVALVIIVLLAAAFCVTAFTDLIFPKQAQFMSILGNLGNDIDTGFDDIDAKDVEMKLNVKLNEENEDLTELLSEEVVDMVNSVSLSYKVSDNRDENSSMAERFNRISTVVDVYEGEREIASIYGLLMKDGFYTQASFSSDTDFKFPLKMSENDYDVVALEEFVKAELISTLENSPMVNDDYNGRFDFGAKVKAITVTLREDEANELLDKILTEAFKTFGIEGEYGADEYGINELSVSALYSGAFSFSRNPLGVSVALKLDDGEAEFVFFSNKENKAIYGAWVSIDGEEVSVALIDDFEIKDGAKTGTVTIETNGISETDITMPTVTYIAQKNRLRADVRMVEGEDVTEIKFDVTGGDNAIDATLRFDFNSKEMGTAYINIGELPKKDALFLVMGSSSVVDITKDELTAEDKEIISTFVDDLKSFVRENRDSALLSMVGSLIGEDKQTGAEIILGDMGVEHESVQLKGNDRGAFLSIQSDDDVIIYNIHEIGYEDNVVKEIIETNYAYLPGYSESERQYINATMLDGLKGVDALDCAEVTSEIIGEYMITKVHFMDLDDPDNFEEATSTGAIPKEKPTDTVIYFDFMAESYGYVGYLRIE